MKEIIIGYNDKPGVADPLWTAWEQTGEIVRCKDCKRRGTYDCPVYVGGDGMYSEPDDWFCADGERTS